MAAEEVKRIRLLAEVTHGGLKLPAGSEVAFGKRRAEWLIEQGFAEASSGLVVATSFATAPRQAPSQPLRRRCCGWK